ncbi:phosphatidylinositol-specific phospholipase C1-like protein [Sphingomonas sanguinis]|uniref:Phosphatidylinositol-specific phospholipase C1-like protein n=1 Tax=Sphingomonas sanguinis TaxID=33051 RepID=A0ABU5LML1_9SPHN|nr:phosphatidylinositol-specific phospholipase C1-like protein [Sphingomonas sanguinis]MDZ7281179.1 phosphatidylinositol-specific phospholipase C1-like protein [Sphingomonas sanguinis]
MKAFLTLAAVLATAAAPAPQAPLRMNDIQVVGSHNSYKKRIAPAVFAELERRDPKLATALDYDHLTLAQQLDRGVRQLEIDIFADPEGGRFAHPKGEALAKAAGQQTGFDEAAMMKPGFKVFHIPEVDYRSCGTFKQCIGQMDAWSRAHPRHLPIMVTINAADRPINKPGVTDPLPLTAPLLDALDGEIRDVLKPDRIITPDDVRGNAPTLREAVTTRGWPTLESTRGKIYFVLDTPADVSDRYRAGHPSLKGRPIFGWYDTDQPEASVEIVGDPRTDGAKIKEWVKQGFIVRTRSDADTKEARENDHARAKAAIDSGAQAVSTDYYPGAPTRGWNRGFTVTLPGGVMERCNPVTQPVGCRLPK